MKTRITKADIIITAVCVILLVFTFGSVGKRGQELSKRVVCAGNQRQLLTGITNFANENEGSVPDEGMYSGFWPFDISAECVNQMLEYMGINIEDYMPQPGTPEWYNPTDWIPVQDIFYCPSNYQQKIVRESYWSFGVYPTRTQVLGFRICGYVPLWEDGYNQNGGIPVLGTGDKQWVGSIYIANPAETELIVDAILSQFIDLSHEPYDPADFPNGNFGQITVGGNPAYGFFDSSGHLKTFREPYGSNIGFVDGHVEWRPFSEMEVRYTIGSDDLLRWWW